MISRLVGGSKEHEGVKYGNCERFALRQRSLKVSAFVLRRKLHVIRGFEACVNVCGSRRAFDCGKLFIDCGEHQTADI